MGNATSFQLSACIVSDFRPVGNSFLGWGGSEPQSLFTVSGCKRTPLPRGAKNHFFLEGPKKKRFLDSKEKGPAESLGQNPSAPSAVERCEKVGCSPARLRRYLVVLSGRVCTSLGRPHRARGAQFCRHGRWVSKGRISRPLAAEREGVGERESELSLPRLFRSFS